MILHKLISAICITAMLFNLSAHEAEAKKKDEKAKYVFLFIGDGMGSTHVAVAESYPSGQTGRSDAHDVPVPVLRNCHFSFF